MFSSDVCARMPLAPRQRWWTRGPAAHDFTLEGRWIALLGLGGLVTILIFSAWRYDPAAEEIEAPLPPPSNVVGPADFHQLPAVQIQLHGDASGRLTGIACNGRPARDLNDLRSQIREFVGPAVAMATVEAQLNCDGRLRFEYTQQVIDAIAAFPGADGRTMIPLVDRIRFSPPK